MCKKLQLIRGQRILNQLNETSVNALRQNAKQIPAGDREAAAGPIQVQKLELTPSQPSGTLQIDAETHHEGNTYTTTILFEDVIFEDSDQGDNITFKGSDGEMYNIMPIKLSQNNAKVRCECLDFYWRFAPFNAQDGSLLGQSPGPYQKKSQRKPVNPNRVPGVCKHLIKTIETLQQSKVVTA